MYLMLVEEADTLHLVEHRVVRRVDLIPSVHVTHRQECVQPRTHQLALVCRRVRSQHVGRVDVVAF